MNTNADKATKKLPGIDLNYAVACTIIDTVSPRDHNRVFYRYIIADEQMRPVNASIHSMFSQWPSRSAQHL